MKTLKYLIVGILIGSFIIDPLKVMAETREQFIQNSKDVYIPAAKTRAAGLESTVQSKIQSTWAGRPPEQYWGGTSILRLTEDTTSDMWRMFGSFGSCVGFYFRVSVSWRGFRYTIRYRYPIQTIHSHHYRQNRYILSLLYPSWLNPIDWFFLPMVNESTQERVLRADLYTKQQMIEHLMPPLLSIPTISSYPANYTAFNNRTMRQQSGMINSTSLQEYFVGPTNFSLIFTLLYYLIPYFRSLLSITGCSPPVRVPTPMTSDSIINLISTRKLLPPLQTYKDDNIMTDYQKWLLNPGICTRLQLANGSIPADMYDNVSEITNPVPQLYPELLSPETNGQRANDFRRICHPKLGTFFPYTTNEAAGSHDIVTAQINVLKAVRYAFATYLTLYRDNPFPKNGEDYVTRNPRNWSGDGIGYYNYDLAVDKVQILYPSSAAGGCRNLGDYTPKFANANTKKTPGKDGLYSFAHWKRFECRSGRTWRVPTPW